jgi:SAM-dependent methyltransferase
MTDGVGTPEDATLPSFDLIERIDVEGLRVATVRSALELDLFTKVADGHDTVAALVAACRSGRRGMHRLVAALRSLELLEEHDGRLHNAATADTYLRDGARGDVRAVYLAWLRNRDHLTRAILDEEFRLEGLDAHTWASHARGDLVRWPTKSATIAETLRQRAIRIPGGARVLDVGCGSGVVGYTSIADAPGATVVGIDNAAVLDVAKTLAGLMGVADRCEHVVGGVETLSALSGPFDLAFLVQVAQYLDDDALHDALLDIRALLRPNGRLMLATIVDDPGTPGYASNWTSAIEMFLSAPGIALRPPSELVDALRSAGFAWVEQHQPWAFSAFADIPGGRVAPARRDGRSSDERPARST